MQTRCAVLSATTSSVVEQGGSPSAQEMKYGTAVAVVGGKAYLLDTSDGDVGILKFVEL